MLDILTHIFKILGCSGFCYLCYLGLKFATVIYICKHSELTENKVKYITRMISKDKHKSN